MTPDQTSELLDLLREIRDDQRELLRITRARKNAQRAAAGTRSRRRLGVVGSAAADEVPRIFVERAKQKLRGIR